MSAAGGAGAERRVVVIGAGPRGLSAVERFAARSAATGARVRLDVVDPFPPGPGHVWRTDQSPLYLMNTPSLFPTVVPDDGVLPVDPLPPLRGMSFERWRLAVVAGEITIDADDAAHLTRMTPRSYPSRRMYGVYLAWVLRTLREVLPPTAELHAHRAEAVGVHVRAQARHRYDVEISGGQNLPADAVVLALGHLDADLRPDQRELVDGAAEFGLDYRPPAVPADVHWDELPAGETVLVRGMGLNFCDVLAQVTEGRGGIYTQEGERMHYHPSGREPVIVAGSRRGVPYRAKGEFGGYYADGARPRHFTLEAVRALAARTRGKLSFDADLWPLIRKDAVRHYYAVLARTAPEAFETDPQRFLQQLDAVLASGDDHPEGPWATRAEALVATAVVPGRNISAVRLARPFEGVSFDSHDAFAAAVVHHLDRDVHGALAAEDDPVRMAIASLNASRTVLKAALADIGIDDASWHDELRRSFEPFVEGLASGPPVLRIQQLAALARAGVVRFLGPDPQFRVDEEAGCFVGTSPWVQDEPVHARHLVEAMSPPNDVRRNISPLLTSMHREGLVRVRALDTVDGVATVPSTGLDVTAAPYRAVRVDGGAEPGIFVLGLQLSAVQWGVAIAAEAGASAELGARTLADADRVAEAVLAPRPVRSGPLPARPGPRPARERPLPAAE
ncbi:FAD/NAD(P)-binding protein [Kocuria flava]|uniref:FAD/NAD(P)-binding protein n=1 Tax=Kocuria flava TaxID=446860 RepID=UPI001FF2DFEB|nr:FAD/NAD(P)-binding protein [Kocuria flava]MCJ8506110.1 FAD/NAD(P)-binding protein [Kocuria flava]